MNEVRRNVVSGRMVSHSWIVELQCGHHAVVINRNYKRNPKPHLPKTARCQACEAAKK